MKWYDQLMAIGDKSGVLVINSRTRYQILDSEEASRHSLLASMKLLCGFPVSVRDTVTNEQEIITGGDGEIWLETRKSVGGIVVTTARKVVG